MHPMKPQEPNFSVFHPQEERPSVFFGKENSPEKPKPKRSENVKEVDYDKNPSLLYHSIENKKWDLSLQIIEQNPDEVSTWIYRSEQNGDKLRWRLLPIHAALVFRAPEHLIAELLSIYPEGAASADDQGMIPLHLAFRYGSSDFILNEILRSYPDGIVVKDNRGRVPLDLHCSSNATTKEPLSPTAARGPNTPSSINRRMIQQVQKSGFATYVALAVEHERLQTTSRLEEEHEAKLELIEEEHNQQVAALATELCASHGQDLQKQLDSNDKECKLQEETLRKALCDLKEAYEAKEIETSHLKEQNDILRRGTEDLEETIALYKERFTSSNFVDNELIGTMMDTERELKKLVAQREAESKRLQRNVEHLSEENAKLKDANSLLEEQVKSLKSTDEELKEAMSVTERELTKFVAAKEAETSKLQGQIDGLKQQKEEMCTKAQELETLNSSYKLQLASSKDSLRILEEKFAETKKASDILMEEYNQKCVKEKMLGLTISEIEHEVKDAMATKEAESDSLQKERNELLRKSASYEEKLRRLEESNSSYQNRLTKVDEENDTLRRECNHLSSTVRDLSTKNIMLEQDVKDLTRKVQYLSSHVITMTEEKRTVSTPPPKHKHSDSNASAKALMMSAAAELMNIEQAIGNAQRELSAKAATKQKHSTSTNWNDYRMGQDVDARDDVPAGRAYSPDLGSAGIWRSERRSE